MRDRIFKSMLDLSSKPPETGAQPPALIVWPETSVPFILSENPSALTAIGETLKDGQVLLSDAPGAGFESCPALEALFSGLSN